MYKKKKRNRKVKDTLGNLNNKDYQLGFPLMFTAVKLQSNWLSNVPLLLCFEPGLAQGYFIS